MADNLPAVRLETSVELVNPDTDSWTAVLPSIAELARSICDTDFVPEAIRNNVAATTAAIMYGREAKLPPMTTLGHVHVIKGKPGMSAEALRALVLSAGHSIVFDETSSALCKVRGRRRGEDDWTRVTYTLEDAKRAGLTSNPNYAKNPRQMLVARASAELCRMVFADVIHGMAAVEELWDQDDTSGPDTAPARANGRTKVQRAKPTKTDDGAAAPAPVPPQPGGVPSAAPSSPPAPPLPGEPGYDGAETPALAGEVATSTTTPTGQDSGPLQGTGPADASSPGSGETASDRRASGRSVEDPPGQDAPTEQPDEPVTKDQQKKMHATFNDLGIKDRAERLHVSTAIVGRELASSNDLTMREASTLIDALSRCKTREHVEALIQLAEERNNP